MECVTRKACQQVFQGRYEIIVTEEDTLSGSHQLENFIHTDD